MAKPKDTIFQNRTILGESIKVKGFPDRTT
jgi:hypothetical protein